MWTAWYLAAARHAIGAGLSTAAVSILSLPVRAVSSLRAAPSGVESALEDTLCTAAVSSLRTLSSLRAARSGVGSPLKNAPRMRSSSVLVYLRCHTPDGCQLGFCLLSCECVWISNRACQYLNNYQVLFLGTDQCILPKRHNRIFKAADTPSQIRESPGHETLK